MGVVSLRLASPSGYLETKQELKLRATAGAGARVILLPVRPCHVWTAPWMQGRFGVRRRGRVRSCVRPRCAALVTAGPDEIRGPAPNQRIALDDALTQTGFAGPRYRPVLPSLRFAPTPPSVAAPPTGKPSPPTQPRLRSPEISRAGKNPMQNKCSNLVVR